MYAIILNLMFLILGLMTFGIMFLMPEGTNAHLTFFVISIIFGVAWIISAFAMTINHFVKAEEMVGEIENLKRKKNTVKLNEQKKDELMKFMEEQVLNVFPKFEEKILKSLSPSNNKDIIALFQKYPELKSSKHLAKLVDDVSHLVKGIYNEKEGIEYSKAKIRTYLVNPWFVWKLKISDDILEFVNEDLTI